MRYKSPKLTTDGVVLKDKKILLIKRKIQPFKDNWAIPGGHVEYNEKVEDAVIREIHEETGLKTRIKELFGIYSDPKRDPRGHVVTVVYLLEIEGGELKEGDDASEAKFFDFNNLPKLAFDHDVIIDEILKRVK